MKSRYRVCSISNFMSLGSSGLQKFCITSLVVQETVIMQRRSVRMKSALFSIAKVVLAGVFLAQRVYFMFITAQAQVTFDSRQEMIMSVRVVCRSRGSVSSERQIWYWQMFVLCYTYFIYSFFRQDTVVRMLVFTCVVLRQCGRMVVISVFIRFRKLSTKFRSCTVVLVMVSQVGCRVYLGICWSFNESGRRGRERKEMG